MVPSPLLAAVAAVAASVAALDPVEAYGSKFFNKDGSQFFIKGVLAHAVVPFCADERQVLRISSSHKIPSSTRNSAS